MRAGDRDAFEAIYERYAAGLVSFCRHLLGSLEEAEDAVQQTFISAHRSMLADDRELHLKAWLYAIARNRSLSMLRGRRERPGLDEEEAEAGPATVGLSSEVERREDLRALLGDLARLPDDQRAALLLAELGAHTHDEIAEVLEVRRDKVKALVFQAREGLIAAREARETPCAEIREELATARGGALRRGNLRRHLDTCEGCRAFRDEVQRQRAALAIILPVVPSLALKHAVLGGAAVGFGHTTASSVGAAGSKAAATKLMAVLALAGGAGGTSYVAVHELHHRGSLPLLSAAAGRTVLPAAAHAKPVALRVPRTPEVTATPLREVQRPAAHHHRAAGHHARPARPRRTFAAVRSRPAPKRHHARRHHARRRGHAGREAEAAPVVISQGQQPAQPAPQPAAPVPAPMPAAPADDDGGDDQGKAGKDHHKHEHGDHGLHKGQFKQQRKLQPPVVVPGAPQQGPQPDEGDDDPAGPGHRTPHPGHRDEQQRPEQDGND